MASCHATDTPGAQSAADPAAPLPHPMLIKTLKGHEELLPGRRSLSQRERAILLVTDGRQSTASLKALFHGDASTMVDTLIERGYLAEAAPPDPPRAPPPPSGSVDSFSGPRSLASARMFLFDLCERMFAARDRDLADQFRLALREARDAAAMAAVSESLLQEVARSAGAERAEAIRLRLLKLVPEPAPTNA